jgi:hypothetical protein
MGWAPLPITLADGQIFYLVDMSSLLTQRTIDLKTSKSRTAIMASPRSCDTYGYRVVHLQLPLCRLPPRWY